LLLSVKHLDKEVPNKDDNTPTGERYSGHRECLLVLLLQQQNSYNFDRADFKQCISCRKGTAVAARIQYCGWFRVLREGYK
jgi:hypothetical protein